MPALISSILSFVMSATTIRFVMLTGLVAALGLLVDLLISFIPSWFGVDGLTSATSAFTPEIWYFVDYLQLQYGLSIVFGAYVARFLIRRLPVIG